MQDPKSKELGHVGVTVGLGRHRDYQIKLVSGSVLWRNRRFLRPIFSNENGDVHSYGDVNSGAGFVDGDILNGGSSTVT